MYLSKSEVAQSCPTLCDPMDCSPWNFPGKSTGVGCHFLLQEIFLTQGSNPGLPHYRQRPYFWAAREEVFIQRNCKTLIWKYIYIPMLIAALFTVARTWKQPKCPLMLNKEDATYTQWNTIQYHKKHKILLFVMIWMDLEGIMVSEISQSEEDKYCMISLIHGLLKQQQQSPKTPSS